jgi:hypothetical protein
MHAVIVVESMFGNTDEAARAVAAGLSETLESVKIDVRVVPVTEAPEMVPDRVDLLVVGGPTHAFGLTRERTREDAVRQGGHPTGGADVGVREWLDALPPAQGHLAFAAFDTRVDKKGLPGSAAKGIDKRLRHLGYERLLSPASFYVEGMDGPLRPGEVERARAWGSELATRLSRSIPAL